MFNILIKNGNIIDGTGKAPPYQADIAVRSGKIIDIGQLGRGRAEIEINAEGYAVSPGFIDIQNHSDSYGALFKDPSLESMLHQGITTVLLGQCGSSLAPLLKGSLVSIQKWTDVAGINVDWSSLSEFYRGMSFRGMGPNIASLIGHATLRRDLIGDDTRSLSEREEKQIISLYKRSLKEGAWGISVGLEYSHERSVEEKELLELLSVTASAGGVASFHLRDEESALSPAIDEVISLAKNSKVRTKISHLKLLSGSGTTQETISKLDKKGVDIYFDVHPYTVSAKVLYLLLPKWASEGGKKELLERIKNDSLRKDIIKELREKNYPYNKIKVADSRVDETIIGKNIASLAQNQGITPEEVLLNLVSASEDRTIVFIDNESEEALETLLSHPKAMIATDGSGWKESDRNTKGLNHPRSFGATARVLSRYVRERKVLGVEEAIYKMSGFPASFLGLKNRGTLEVGNYADIVLFSEDNVKDLATFEQPYRYSRGIEFVIINGEVVIDKGRFNGMRAGEVLRR